MSCTPNLDRLLEEYPPIGLAEMDGVSLMNRVDTKYLLGLVELGEVLRSLSDRYRVLEVEGERRSEYTTLYFDTPARDCYRDHHNGKANRRKFRMRAYASSEAAFFEVKTKTNRGRTIKKRIPIPAIAGSLGQESLALAESIAGRSLPLLPQIWTGFRRITLVATDAAERVTIDTDLEFRSGSDGTRTSGLRESLSDAVIVEVKQERATRESAIRQRIRELQIRPMRVSKYCLGSALLDPSLKRNRFKKKLLALKKPNSTEAC